MVETIYRVEDELGYGPYNPGPRDSYADKSRPDRYALWQLVDSSDWKHPEPAEDGITLWPDVAWSDTRHGFETVDKMLEWFHSGSLEGLIHAGYVVMEYRIPARDVLHGLHQSVFRPDSAEFRDWITKEDLC